MNLRIVELYKDYFEDNSFVNYIKSRTINFEIFWFLKSRHGKMFLKKHEILANEFRCLLLLLFNINGFRNKKIICFGSHYSLLLITKLFGKLLGSDYHLFIYNFYLHNLGTKKVIRSIIHFLFYTKYTTLIVQSPNELNYFKPFSKNIIHFVPYCENPGFKMDDSKAPDGDYLFSGGYSNRDYDLILRCAQMNPSIKFVLVVSSLNKNMFRKKVSDNVLIYEEVNVSVFHGLMYKSYGVIIPLKEDVGSSGQMVCLAAIKMAKPIIYCNISSINYYFCDNECGIPYTLGDLDSLNNAVSKIYSTGCDQETMGKKAYSNFIKNFTLNNRNEKLLEYIIKS